MIQSIASVLVVVGAASGICYLLLTTRSQDRPVRRRASADGGASDGGDSFDGYGWSFGNWFGHGTSDSSGHATDSCGGSDSGGDSGSSDCGGGDGGGGDGGGGGD